MLRIRFIIYFISEILNYVVIYVIKKKYFCVLYTQFYVIRNLIIYVHHYTNDINITNLSFYKSYLFHVFVEICK